MHSTEHTRMLEQMTKHPYLRGNSRKQSAGLLLAPQGPHKVRLGVAVRWSDVSLPWRYHCVTCFHKVHTVLMIPETMMEEFILNSPWVSRLMVHFSANSIQKCGKNSVRSLLRNQLCPNNNESSALINIFDTCRKETKTCESQSVDSFFPLSLAHKLWTIAHYSEEVSKLYSQSHSTDITLSPLFKIHSLL